MSHGSGAIASHFVLSSGITYQGAGTATVHNTGVTSSTVAYPTGMQIGDVVVAAVTLTIATVPTNPTGFTSAISNSAGGVSPSFRVSYRVVDGTEGSNFTVTHTTSQDHCVAYLFRGVDNVNPIDVAGQVFGTTSTTGTSFDVPTLTTTKTGAALFYIGAINATTGTWSPPASPGTFIERYDSVAASPGTTHGYQIWSGSGATGTVSVVHSSAQRGCAGLIALRPA